VTVGHKVQLQDEFVLSPVILGRC